MKCSYCLNNKGGSYKDWCKDFSFNLCVPCCFTLEFVPNKMEYQKECLECGCWFSPRGTWQKNCVDCWLKSQKKKAHTKKVVKKKEGIWKW